MLKFDDYVFVLWGNQFDEATATIFVTELREAGLRVKVVGLTPRQINGAHGLALVPDLTLDQALPLAPQAICVILPYASRGIKRLRNDPRIREFFHLAYASNRAKFVVGQFNQAAIAKLGLFPVSADNVVVYPGSEDLVAFARQMAKSLLRTG
jgi:hypothetical protein